MSNSLESFMLNLLPQLQMSGGAGGIPTTIRISNPTDGRAFTTQPARAQRNVENPSGAGHVYSGNVPPSTWIQREQERTPAEAVGTADPAETSARLRADGNRAFAAGNYDVAVDMYTRAIAVDGKCAFNYTNRSFAFYRLGNYARSADDARSAIALDPKFFKGYYRLGLVLLVTGDYANALANFRTALSLSSGEDNRKILTDIAKCESKLARTPATPLLMGSPESVSPAASFSASNPSRSANRVDYEQIATLSSNSAVLREELEKYKTSYALQQEIVDCKERSQTIRQLISIATAEQLPQLRKNATEMQEALRRTLKSQNRSAYQEAKKARDEAYARVWSTVSSMGHAIEKLKSIAHEEQEFFQRFGRPAKEAETKGEAVPEPTRLHDGAELPAAPTAAAGEEVRQDVSDGEVKPVAAPAVDTHADASAPEPLVSKPADGGGDDTTPKSQHTQKKKEGEATVSPSSDDQLTTLLARREALAQEFQKAGQVFARTDAAAEAYLRALKEEQKIVQSIKETLAEAAALDSALEAEARNIASTTTQELSKARLDALEQVRSTVDRLKADESSFKQTAAQGDQLLADEAALEEERLLLERKRIETQAAVEWFKVRDESERRIAALQNQVKRLQQQISDGNAKQKHVQERILELINGDHPELAWKSMSSGSRILRLVKGSGLWLNLSFSDFQIISTLSSTVNSKVYHVNRRGESLALKEIAVDDNVARRKFEREVHIVANCSHPNIVRIKGVFFDGPFAYILLPYFHHGSLKAFLSKKNPYPWPVLQDFLRQLVSGVAYLHDRGIVHADLKPSNVLLSDDRRPIISDFGIAKDHGRYGDYSDLTATATMTGSGSGGLVGTMNYMAPELLATQLSRPTCTSDVWSLGLTMYQIAASNAYFFDASLEEPAMPVIMPSSPRIEIPAKRVGGDEKLADLISSALVVNVDRRATAVELLAHPYFSSSLSPVDRNDSNGALAKSDERLEAVRSYIHAMRTVHPQKVLVSVSRPRMVQSLSEIFVHFNEEELINPIMVVFQGEAGIDEGALTTEMFTLYYTQLVQDRHALVCAAEDGLSAASATDGSGTAGGTSLPTGVTYLPAEDADNIPTADFELLGKVLLKSIIENRPLPLQLNLSVLKFFCGGSPSMVDLEEFDRELAETLKRMRLLSSEDLAAASLDFSVFSAEYLARVDGGKYTCESAVNVENVRDYVNMRVEYDLVEKRRNGLQAIKDGFYHFPSIGHHLKLLYPLDLALLLCGMQHVPAQTIVDALEFQGFGPTSQTPQHLKELVMEMTQNNLRRFLQLCTSTATVPAHDAMQKIKVLRCEDTQRLPVGHGCVYQLDLPDYNDKQILRDKLGMALVHVNDGFHIV